ncbi:1-aminocyclopropane-1-carboxylate deaminase/D-cysteine desulfhydrase [Puia dinghuensis]|uniref:1-aminocyclopropane-1-carboxylate deaminase n=1 Tax=Puia dinghuensis TaxID=1792502 RepID=A0A8J2UAJ2_9BACT|nr:1-aminocyclopropane-1-carboxylate deaminase [Puia dinghuensis]GGA90797.1 1-aminocyclopropane-1-carboxylate deaminase [Puia dinghuensis]
MNHQASLIQRLQLPAFTASQIHVDVMRLDQLHPIVSGNKWFKLQKHLALASPGRPILTFGGAWSNHLVATAYAAKQAGFPAIGIIRGEQPSSPSATLTDAAAYGMQLEFVSREQYGQKENPTFLQQLTHRYPGAYIIPEGGGGIPGITGSQDILQLADTTAYTHICCAIGTGTTFLGLHRASTPQQTIIGVPVLKGFDTSSLSGPRTLFLPQYHFGGYGRHPQILLDFMNDFHRDTGIPTDIVYTGKLFYAIRESIRQHLFHAHSRLLIIHSGGLQGNRSLPPRKLDF